MYEVRNGYLLTESVTSLMTSQLYCKECDCSVSTSIYLLSGAISSTSVITAIVTAILTVIIMRLFCKVKCRRRNKSASSTQCHDRSSLNASGPLYEELELTNKNLTLNFSQNADYQCTSRPYTSYQTNILLCEAFTKIF